MLYLHILDLNTAFFHFTCIKPHILINSPVLSEKIPMRTIQFIGKICVNIYKKKHYFARFTHI